MNNIKSAGFCINIVLGVFVLFAVFGNIMIKNSVESLEKEYDALFSNNVLDITRIFSAEPPEDANENELFVILYEVL